MNNNVVNCFIRPKVTVCERSKQVDAFDENGDQLPIRRISNTRFEVVTGPNKCINFEGPQYEGIFDK